MHWLVCVEDDKRDMEVYSHSLNLPSWDDFAASMMSMGYFFVALVDPRNDFFSLHWRKWGCR